jgi:hypothetical protein
MTTRVEDINSAYVMGRGLESVYHFINLIICVHRYFRWNKASFHKVFIFTTAGFCVNAALLALHRRRVVDNSFYVLRSLIYHISAFVYIVIVIYRFQHFRFAYPKATVIQRVWYTMNTLCTLYIHSNELNCHPVVLSPGTGSNHKAVFKPRLCSDPLSSLKN